MSEHPTSQHTSADKTENETENSESVSGSSTKKSNSVFPGIYKYIQLAAGAAAIFAFIVWLSERPIRLQENTIRETDMFLKMTDIVENSRDGVRRPIVSKAVEYLFDPNLGGIKPCEFNYSGINIGDFNLRLVENGEFCKVSTSENTMFEGGQFIFDRLSLCADCSVMSLLNPEQVRSANGFFDGRMPMTTVKGNLQVGVVYFEKLRVLGELKNISKENIGGSFLDTSQHMYQPKGLSGYARRSIVFGMGMDFRGYANQVIFDSRNLVINDSILEDSFINIRAGDSLSTGQMILYGSKILLNDECPQHYVGPERKCAEPRRVNIAKRTCEIKKPSVESEVALMGKRKIKALKIRECSEETKKMFLSCFKDFNQSEYYSREFSGFVEGLVTSNARACEF